MWSKPIQRTGSCRRASGQVERHLLPFVVVLSRFQMEYSNFITKHGAQQCQFGPFEEVEKLRGKLPDGIVEFLTNEGMCSYADGFLFTVAPADYDEILSAWGVKGGVPSHGLRRMCLLLQEALLLPGSARGAHCVARQ